MTNANRALMAALLSTAALAFAAPALAAEAHGLDRAGMDTSVAPGNDFFRYANGKWVDTAEIPADRASWGPGFAALREKTLYDTHDLIEAAIAAHPAPGSDLQKIADFYASFLDEKAIDAAGVKPLKDGLAAIAKIKDVKTLSAYLGGTIRADVDPLNNTNFYTDNVFGIWVAQGLKDPDHYMPYLLQGGLGMPDRDYYLATDAHMADLRTKYRAHIEKMLTLAGAGDAKVKADHVFEFETGLAKAHVDRAESEDFHKADNPWPRAEFATKAPGMDWDAFFASAGLSKENVIDVWQPKAVVAESALVKSASLAAWKDYLTYHLISHYANELPGPISDENFAFNGTALSGTPKQQDRWKRAVGATSEELGEAVGKIYVEKYFPPEAKAKIESMVKELIAAFGKRIDGLAWMAPPTKAEAKAKLATLYVGVGYPEKWRSYAGLEVVRGDAFGNERRAELFEYKYRLAKLGGPVDHTEWCMTPETVNAVNMPLQNALNFPAAYLQPPNFDPAAPAAYNYGDIGATIGHEISHSFDDQGAQIDSKGRLRDWWTPADYEHFKSASASLIAQYDAYKPFPDAHVNGKLTISENIADLAGLGAAYDAFHMSLGGKAAPVADGWNGDQQFFLAYGQSWRAKFREADARKRLVTDSHAPARYRADIVRNLDTWYPAFKVKSGQELYLAPEKRVRMW